MIIHRDETFRVVVNLRTPLKDAEVIGTGMFVVKGTKSPYLVTASHVAKATTDQTSVILSDADGKSAALRLTSFNRSLEWRHHPLADVSALPIIMSERLAQHMDRRCLTLDQFHTQKVPVSRDDELTAIGFPNGLGVSGAFCPLTFRSYASSGFITLTRADTQTPQEFFLLENPSIGGYSGCPVLDLGYRVVGGETIATRKHSVCYGLMHGVLPDNTGGNLAAVTPAFYLEQLLCQRG